MNHLGPSAKVVILLAYNAMAPVSIVAVLVVSASLWDNFFFEYINCKLHRMAIGPLR